MGTILSSIMSSTSAFLVLLTALLISEGSTISLPGRHCPQVPPTHRKECLGTTREKIIYSVPFSASVPSNLFRELNESEILTNFFDLLLADYDTRIVSTLRRCAEEEEFPFLVNSILNFDNNPGGYLNSSVLTCDYKKKLCPAPIHEENVRFWCEYPIALIWSCVDRWYQSDHEEALIVLKRDTANVTQEEVRQLARKFVGEDLVALIDFGKHIQLTDGGQGDRLYICTNQSYYRVAIVVGVVCVLLIGAGLHYFK